VDASLLENVSDVVPDLQLPKNRFIATLAICNVAVSAMIFTFCYLWIIF
jgi:hypothetical protein